MKKENRKEEVHVVSHFKAPVEVVFDAFSTAEALNAWWGPVETKNSTISLDFRTGGTFFYKMEGSEQVNYARFLFHRIERPPCWSSPTHLPTKAAMLLSHRSS